MPFHLCGKKTITAQNHTNAKENSLTNLSTGSIYSSIQPPTSQNKILRHGFTDKTLDKVYQLPFKITKEVKVVMFEYKITHNILPTQFSLHRDGIAERSFSAPKCTPSGIHFKTAGYKRPMISFLKIKVIYFTAFLKNLHIGRL